MIPGFSLSFFLSLFHSLLSWQQALWRWWRRRREERDDVAVVAAVVAGHGAGWLAGWSRHLFFSPHRSWFSYTLYAWFVNLFSPHRSRFSYASYDVSFCIITIDRTEEQEETRRIRRKRHRYLYCPFCMPSAILNIRSIFFFKYVHSSASSKKAIK